MIEAIVGDIGAGKNAVATMMARQRADQGFAVYANWPIYDERITYIQSWREVAHLADAEVFLDEMHLWFPAREWAKMGKIEEMSIWAQSRHDGLNVVWISQSPGQVDVQIREVFTAYIYKVVRLFGPGPRGKLSKIEKRIGAWAIVKKYAKEDYGKEKRLAKSRWFVNLSKLFGTWDTHAFVGMRDGTGARAGRGTLEPQRAAKASPAETVAVSRAFWDVAAVPSEVFNKTYWRPPADPLVLLQGGLENDFTTGQGRVLHDGDGGDVRSGVGGGASTGKVSPNMGRRLAESFRLVEPDAPRLAGEV